MEVLFHLHTWMLAGKACKDSKDGLVWEAPGGWQQPHGQQGRGVWPYPEGREQLRVKSNTCCLLTGKAERRKVSFMLQRTWQGSPPPFSVSFHLCGFPEYLLHVFSGWWDKEP